MAAVLAVAVLFSGASPADAATRITGALKGSSGFTMVGVSPGGTGPSVKLGSKGRFKLVFPDRSGKNATIQLIRPDGTYFGPVVLRKKDRKGRVVFSHLSGRSGKLGVLVRRSGFAIPKKAARTALVNTRKKTRGSKGGKPVGAGRLGFGGAATLKGRIGYRMGSTLRALPGEEALGVDRDADGLPLAIDVDANGNGILDSNDPTMPPPQNRVASTSTTLAALYPGSVNANASGVTEAELDAMTLDLMSVGFRFKPSTFTPALSPTSVDVDCGRLPWCRPGDGAATVFATNDVPGAPAFGSPWAAFDPDGSGLPNLTAPPAESNEPGPPAWKMAVKPSVPRESISPADTMNFVARSPSGTATLATALGPYFITSPAVKSIGSGSSTTELDYPGTQTSPGASDATPIEIDDGTARITFWRPQRSGIPGAEPDPLVDMGGLKYVVYPPNGGPTGGCSELSPVSPGVTIGTDGPFTVLTDGAQDAPPDPANTITFSVDLTTCLTRLGKDPAQCGRLVISTETRNASQATQEIWVRMPGATVCQLGGGG